MKRLAPAFPLALRAYRESSTLQIAALAALWCGCQAVTTALRIPLPSGVVGFFLLMLFLTTKWITPAWFDKGASDLHNHLTLFFIPAMVSLVGRPELLGPLGLKLLAAVVVGTLLVMTSTALVMELGFRRSMPSDA